jgi:hypothetical protein
MQCPRAIKHPPAWLWAIPLLLLAVMFGIPRLNQSAFGWDEVSSMNAIGGTSPDSSLSATWGRIAANSADQAVGFALVLSQWGRLVGWTEFATRTLPFFLGLLALAWVYRVGRDFFLPSIGLFALAILATSVYFGVFLHVLRVFTAVALVVTMTLWAYWRVMLHPKQPGLASKATLILGGIGILYTHYFAVPFLVALGLYHLFFAPKTRRWWFPILALALVALVFVPQFRVFLDGISKNLDNTLLHEKALTAPEVLYALLYYFGNGSILLFLLAASGLLIMIRRRFLVPETFYVLFLILVTLILIIAANEVMQVFAPDRARYLMALWPLLALALGVGMWHFRYVNRRLAVLGITVWVSFGLWSNLATTLADEVDEPQPPWQEMRADLQMLGSPDSDVFVFHGFPSRMREFYVASTIPMRREIIESWNTDEDFRKYIGDEQRVWIGTHWRDEFGIGGSEQPSFHRFMVLLEEEGFVRCARFIDDPEMRLDLYTRTPVFCPSLEARARFGDGITLSSLASAVQGNRLFLDMLWTIAPQIPPETYSVALHLYDAQTEALVEQADYGLPHGPVGPVHTEIDLADLPDGRYTVILGVYEWQTGARLSGTDLDSGAQGDLVPLASFRLGE